MTAALHATTRVLPGKKIEIDAAELREGQSVDVFVVPRSDESQRVKAPRDIMDFLRSLPPGPRSAATWVEVERQMREERESWDR